MHAFRTFIFAKAYRPTRCSAVWLRELAYLSSFKRGCNRP